MSLEVPGLMRFVDMGMMKDILIGLVTGLVSGIYSGLIVAKLARFNAAKGGILRAIQEFGYQVSPPGRVDWKQTSVLSDVYYSIEQLRKLEHATAYSVLSLGSALTDAVRALEANQTPDGVRRFNEDLLICQKRVGDLRPDLCQILGPSLMV